MEELTIPSRLHTNTLMMFTCGPTFLFQCAPSWPGQWEVEYTLCPIRDVTKWISNPEHSKCIYHFYPQNFPSTGILCHTEVEFSENNIQNCSQFSIGVFSLFILQILWSFTKVIITLAVYFFCFFLSVLHTYIKHVQRRSTHHWLLK